MSVNGGPKIVEDGLIYCISPEDAYSYIDGDPSVYDLTDNYGPSEIVGVTDTDGVWQFGNQDGSRIRTPIPGSQLTGPFTFSAWVKNTGDDGSQSSRNRIFTIWRASDSSRFIGFVENNVLKVYQDGPATTYSVGSIQYNKWYYLSYSYDGSIVNVFKDAIISDSQALTFSTSVNDNLRIGIFSENVSLYDQRRFFGFMSDIQIYNRPIGFNEHLQNYNATKGRFGY